MLIYICIGIAIYFAVGCALARYAAESTPRKEPMVFLFLAITWLPFLIIAFYECVDNNIH